jgi:hypothetical protein
LHDAGGDRLAEHFALARLLAVSAEDFAAGVDDPRKVASEAQLLAIGGVPDGQRTEIPRRVAQGSIDFVDGQVEDIVDLGQAAGLAENACRVECPAAKHLGDADDVILVKLPIAGERREDAVGFVQRSPLASAHAGRFFQEGRVRALAIHDASFEDRLRVVFGVGRFCQGAELGI